MTKLLSPIEVTVLQYINEHPNATSTRIQEGTNTSRMMANIRIDSLLRESLIGRSGDRHYITQTGKFKLKEYAKRPVKPIKSIPVPEAPKPKEITPMRRKSNDLPDGWWLNEINSIDTASINGLKDKLSVGWTVVKDITDKLVISGLIKDGSHNRWPKYVLTEAGYTELNEWRALEGKEPVTEKPEPAPEVNKPKITKTEKPEESVPNRPPMQGVRKNIPLIPASSKEKPALVHRPHKFTDGKYSICEWCGDNVNKHDFKPGPCPSWGD